MKRIRVYILALLLVTLYIISCNGAKSIKGVWEIDKYMWKGDNSPEMQAQIDEWNSKIDANERERMFFEDNTYGSIMPDGTKYKEESYRLEDGHIEVNGVLVRFELTDNNTMQLSDAEEGLIIQLRRVK